MKIAVINQPWNSIVPPVKAGSIAILTYETARRMAKSHDVTIYARKGKGERAREEHEGVRYRRFSTMADRRLLRLVRKFAGRFAKLRPMFSRQVFYYFYARQIALDMRQKGFDVVHIHNMSQFIPIIRKHNPAIKIVLHMHCEWLTQLDRDMIASRLAQTDYVISVCDYITNKLPKRFSEFEGRCGTVHNGVNLEKFAPKDGDGSDGEKTLLFVGRVSPEKGIHVILDAFPMVVERHPDARLEIVGPIGSAPMEFVVALSDDPMVSGLSEFYDGRYKDHLDRRLTDNTRDRVVFTGNLDHADLIGRLENAAIFLHPSVWGEPFPLAVLEAMAAGVPVVASRVGGLVESVEHGETGLLVDPDDPQALAGAINEILSDDDKRKRMARRARERAVEGYSWDRMADDLVSIYDSVCAKG